MNTQYTHDNRVIERFPDGTVVTMAPICLEYAARMPAEPKPVHILHGNSKKLKDRRIAVHNALRASVEG